MGRAIVAIGVLSIGLVVAEVPAQALEPRQIAFVNPRSQVSQGDILRANVQILEGDGDPEIFVTFEGSGCQAIGPFTAVITDEAWGCHVTAFVPADDTYEAAYAYTDVNHGRLAQAPLIGQLSGSGVYGDIVVSSVTGGSNSNDLTYQYDDNCALDGAIDPVATARHRIIGGQGTCAVTATRPGNGDYLAVSTVMTIAVHPAVAAVDADDTTKIAGDGDPVSTWTISGLVLGDTASVVSGAPACTRPAGETPGTYDITCDPGTLSAANYMMTAGSQGSLLITSRRMPPLSATATAGDPTTVDPIAALGGSGSGMSLRSFGSRSTNAAMITLSGGTLTYTAPRNFTGTDTFTYTVVDRFENESIVTVTVEVAAATPITAPAPDSTPPTAPVDSVVPLDPAASPALTDPTTTTVSADAGGSSGAGLPTTTAQPAPPSGPDAPTAAPAADARALVTPADVRLPSTGTEPDAVLVAAGLMVLVGFGLRRARRI